jgi:hypothetical protein
LWRELGAVEVDENDVGLSEAISHVKIKIKKKYRWMGPYRNVYVEERKTFQNVGTHRRQASAMP